LGEKELTLLIILGKVLTDDRGKCPCFKKPEKEKRESTLVKSRS